MKIMPKEAQQVEKPLADWTLQEVMKYCNETPCKKTPCPFKHNNKCGLSAEAPMLWELQSCQRK